MRMKIGVKALDRTIYLAPLENGWVLLMITENVTVQEPIVLAAL